LNYAETINNQIKFGNGNRIFVLCCTKYF